MYPSVHYFPKVLSTLIFCVLSFGFQASLNATPNCRIVLSQEQIGSVYPRVLGLVFNDVYKSYYGDGSKVLKTIFDTLGIGGAQNPALVLQTVLSHLNQSPGFIDRFYPLNLNPEKRMLLVNILTSLNTRIKLLESFVIRNPLKGSDSSKLLASLFQALLSDFKPNRGFKIYDEKDLYHRLETAHKNYFSTEDSSYPTLGAYDDNWRSTFSDPEPGSFTSDNDLIVFNSENKAFVRQKIQKIDLWRLAETDKKVYFSNFDDLSALKDMHYYILHKSEQNSETLVSNYIKGMDFVLDIVVNPSNSFNDSDMKPAILSAFFFSLHELLSGKADLRFNENFSAYLKDQMKNRLEDLRYHLSIDTPRPLFPTATAFIGLNLCLKAVGLKEIPYPEH